MPRKRTVAAVCVALLLVVAGCTGDTPVGDDDGDALDRAEMEDAPEAEVVAGDDAETTASTGDAPATTAEQHLIRRGEIRLEVESFEEAEHEVRELTADRGGYVSDSARETAERHGEPYTVGELTIRVPSEEFEATMDDLETLGEVQSTETETEDVTDEIVDLEARLENLRAERDRLRDLYEEANETEEVLAVQSELSDTQGEIERLEAQKRTLEDRVAHSTIRVRLAEPTPEPEEEPHAAWYETPLTSAFLDSVEGVATSVRALAVAGAYAAPYLLAFGTPVALGGFLVYRRIDIDTGSGPD